MLWIPPTGDWRAESNLGTVGAASIGTSVTTGGSSSTKGTPAQLIASTAFDAFWVTIVAAEYGTTGNASQGAFDLLIGAATESVLIANMLMGYCGGVHTASLQTGPKRWDFPLYIPAGSRLAAQSAGVRTSTAMRVGIMLYGGAGYPAWQVGSKVTTYGMGTVPDGTSITPGASGAEGSWTQITASTSEDHFAFVPSFQPTGDTTVSNSSVAVDLGFGAATEEEIMGQYWFRSNTNETMEGPYFSMPCFKRIPSGSRMVMRASNHTTNDSGYNGVIHAVS